MEWYYIVLIVIGCIVVLLTILFPFILSYLLYAIHMVRTKKTKWGRECSSKKNEEQLKMWDEGLNYIKPYKDKIIEETAVCANYKGENFKYNLITFFSFLSLALVLIWFLVCFRRSF